MVVPSVTGKLPRCEFSPKNEVPGGSGKPVSGNTDWQAAAVGVRAHAPGSAVPGNCVAAPTSEAGRARSRATAEDPPVRVKYPAAVAKKLLVTAVPTGPVAPPSDAGMEAKAAAYCCAATPTNCAWL